MSRMTPRIVCLAALLSACGGPQQPAPEPTPPKKTTDQPAPVVAPPNLDIRGELLGSLVMGSLDSIVAMVGSYVQPALPATLQPMVQPEAMKALLFKQAGLESVAPALDSSRPLAIAFADPMTYRQGQLGSALVAIPVKDASAFADYLGRMASRQETTPWKDRIFIMNGNPLLLRVERDWAFLASHEKLLQGARGALLPLIGKAAAGAVQLSIDLPAVESRYGAQLDRMADAAAGELNKPGLAGMQVMMRRWIGYLKSMRAAELRLELGQDRIRALVTARALPQGEFRKYLDALPVGEPWGAKYVPADSAFFVLNRTAPDSRLELLDQGLKLLKVALGDALGEASLKELREAAMAATQQFGAEAASGVWASADGGVGLGSAMSVKDPAAAQKQLAKVVRIASKLLGKLIEKNLPAAGDRLKGLKVGVGVRPGALPVGGLKADLYELNIAWPRPKDKAARDKIAEAKKMLGKLLGPKPTLAFAATGEVGLMSFGKDFKKRLADLVAIAKGGQASAEEKVARELAAGRRLTTLFHMPIASLIESGLRVADQLTTVPGDVRAAVQKMLPGPGRNLPVTAVMHKEGDALLGELTVSADLVGVLAKWMMLGRGGAVAP